MSFGEFLSTGLFEPLDIKDTRFYVKKEEQPHCEECMRHSLAGVGQLGIGFGVNFGVVYDPRVAGTPEGLGTYKWSGSAGTSFWIDRAKPIFWLSMIQAYGHQQRIGAADDGAIATDVIYRMLSDSPVSTIRLSI